jgi:phospholipid/cholesterol/gamma-HCH transport system substrate-binding protein
MTGQENGRSRRGSLVAIGALLLAVALTAVLLLRHDDGYTIRARFVAATQMIPGNVVQVAGRKVGEVESVELTRDGQAELVLRIDDEGITPLRTGTEASLRLKSLSSVVSRYVDLRIPPAGGRAIPEGGVIPAWRTTSAVSLDQLFAMFDRDTRRGLRGFIRGNRRVFADRPELANAGFEYLNPALVASSRLFREINRDSEVLRDFVVNSSRLVTDIAERRGDLSSLVDRLATMTGAIAREQGSLSTAISRLPPFMRRANSTFVDLRATLDDLAPMVEEARPVTPRLRAVLAQLRPFAQDARPTIRDLSALVRSPGREDDLIDLARAIPRLRDVAIGPVQRNGAERPGSFPSSTESLRRQIPIWSFFRPYAVDFTGWLDDFSHSGIYDANGSASRVATSVNAFAAVGSNLLLVPEELRDEVTQLSTVSGQSNRCPGSIERGSAWRPTPDFACDPSQVPPGR